VSDSVPYKSSRISGGRDAPDAAGLLGTVWITLSRPVAKPRGRAGHGERPDSDRGSPAELASLAHSGGAGLYAGLLGDGRMDNTRHCPKADTSAAPFPQTVG
jgi:hypothetical protein